MNDAESPFWAVARGDIPPPPAAKLLGWKLLEPRRGSGRIRVQFEATQEFTNPMGNVQGGLLAAMLDEFGTGRGSVVHRGGSVAFLQDELHNAEGDLLATGSATARLVRLEPGGLKLRQPPSSE